MSNLLTLTTQGCKMVPMSTPNIDRTRSYATQRGISTVGMTKNRTATAKVVAKLTPAQRRRLAKKVAA